MQYKVRYRPLERLTRDGWVRFSEDQQDRLIASAIALQGAKPDPLPGSTKDGAHGQYRVAEV